MKQQKLRALPSIHQLVDHPNLSSTIALFGREAVVEACRNRIDATRASILDDGPSASAEELVKQAINLLQNRPTLYQKVLNATGVVLHTNLGRAPLAEAAWTAMQAAAGYCDLEMELETGKRASRLRGVQAPIAQLTGAECGLVVNNNAAAVLLSIAGLAGSTPTAISRGHLVEIGGSFRLPTILEASGSPMMEVGSTNRTHLQDYEEAIHQGVGLILLVHKSNFTMSGFVTEPDEEAVIELAHSHGVPVILDLGSGNFTDTLQYGLPHETTVSKAIAKGFDAVCFSGDKLLGGPQAGIIASTHAVYEKLKKHPLARALRCDKTQLAGTIATIELYLRRESQDQIPIWSMIKTSEDDIRTRAHIWQKSVGAGHVVKAMGAIGGGSLPDAQIPGYALALEVPKPEQVLLAMRQASKPLVGHIVNDKVLLHPRTIDPADDADVIDTIKEVLNGISVK